MLTKLIRAGALSAALLVAACGDDSPEGKLKDINEMLGKGFAITEEQKATVDAAIADGKAKMEAGQTEAAKIAFDKALDVLQLAQDAATFNKAD